MIKTLRYEFFVLTPILLWLGGCAASPGPYAGAPVVDRSIRPAPAPQQPLSAPVATPLPASQQPQVQPLPRSEPLRSQEYSTQPVTPENAYATPPGSVPPVATTSPVQVPPAISPPAPPPTAAPGAPATPPPPAEISRQGNQAVVALLDSAAKYVGAGELDKAAASLERALRIEPRNAGIWHDLGQIRLHQHNYPEAESMATKSNSLAGKDNALRARNWRLISYARRATGNASGADAAQAQAVVLERR